MKEAIAIAMESIDYTKERAVQLGGEALSAERLQRLADSGKEILDQVNRYNNSNLKKMADKYLTPR